jgi:hypothetical protein
MYERGHDNSYRAAFLAANEELNEVFRQVEQLRLRQDRVENVLEALRPLLDLPVQRVEREVASAPLSNESVQYNTEYASAPATQAAPATPRYEAPAAADPFQKRIDSILGLAVA